MAAKQQKGLGRGLDAIFDSEDAVAAAPKLTRRAGSVGELDIFLVAPNPKQPRIDFNEDSLAELAESIRAMGVIQPITVMPVGEEAYVIISGERRWRAAQMAGLLTIPAYVRTADDQALHEMALVENIQRQDLNPIEIALSLYALIDEHDLTQEELSDRVGKKRSTIANYLRLLEMPAEVQLALKKGIISMGHAKTIASAEAGKQLMVLRKIIAKGLSVRKAEELVALTAGDDFNGDEREDESLPTRRKREEDEKEFPESYARLVELLENIFSDDIAIKGGKIVIGFKGEEDIERFIQRLS